MSIAKMLLFLTSLMFAVLICPNSYVNAEVIFEESFESQPLWYTKKSFAQGQTCVEGEHATKCIVPNWTSWKSDEIWNPYDPLKPRSGSRPGLEISGFANYSSSGKSLIITNEHHNGTDGSGWGSDTILGKDLGADYKELYMQFKIRYQPGWTWKWVPTYMAHAIKTFRWMHWDRTGSAYMPASGGPGTLNTNAPMFFLDIGENEYGGGVSNLFRCDPQQDTYVNYAGVSYKVKATHTSSVSNLPPNTTYWSAATYNANYPAWSDSTVYRISNYFCGANRTRYDAGSGAKFFRANGTKSNIVDDTLSDGKWHKLTMHVKFNTNEQTADGVYELWQDDFLIYSKYDLKYIDIGGDSNIGINGVMLGGNNFANHPYYGKTSSVVTMEKYAIGGNPPYVPTTVTEQWYAIDDVVISTTPISKDYTISGPKPPSPPHPKSGGWVPGS